MGDIAGSLYEGWGFPQAKDPDSVPLLKPNAFFTDDTIMTLAILKSCLNIQVNQFCKKEQYSNLVTVFAKTMKEYAKMFPNVGYGESFYRWAVEDINDERYRSFGNGSAMRAGIIGTVCGDIVDVITFSFLSAIPTHSHPEGIKGAIVTSVLVYMAQSGYTKKEMLNYALKYYPDGIRTQQELFTRSKDSPIWIAPDMSLEELQDFAPYTNDNSCQYSVPEAVSNFLNSKSYDECIRMVFRYWCDTDTVGAISGGIFAAYDPESVYTILDEYKGKCEALHKAGKLMDNILSNI